MLVGFFNAHIFAPSHSLMQLSASDELRGRIYGVLYVCLQLSATFPTFLIGFIADTVDLSYIFLGMGSILVLAGWHLSQVRSAAIEPS